MRFNLRVITFTEVLFYYLSVLTFLNTIFVEPFFKLKLRGFSETLEEATSPERDQTDLAFSPDPT